MPLRYLTPSGRAKPVRRFDVDDSITPMKTCTKCLREQPIEVFRKNARYKDGHINWCNQCAFEYSRLWREKNSEKERERLRRQYEADPQAARDRVRRSYEKHREKRIAERIQYAKDNPDIQRAIDSRYRESHREELKAATAEWKAANPLRFKETQARARARKHGVEWEIVDYAAILERDKGICHICALPVDATDTATLTFDHIISISKGGPHKASNIAVAHYTCNRVKQ